MVLPGENNLSPEQKELADYLAGVFNMIRLSTIDINFVLTSAGIDPNNVDPDFYNYLQAKIDQGTKT